MNFSEIKEIISLINQSNLTEFQVKDQQFELYLSKNEKSSVNTSSYSSETQKLENLPVRVVDTGLQPSVTDEKTDDFVNQPKGGHQITSPLVGVIYLKPSPDKPEFKKIGDLVKKGEVVCIIEAMKVMNEIVSDVDGVITNVLIENEEVVEFGQALFEVKEG